jgi:hypothetical protein
MIPTVSIIKIDELVMDISTPHTLSGATLRTSNEDIGSYDINQRASNQTTCIVYHNTAFCRSAIFNESYGLLIWLIRSSSALRYAARASRGLGGRSCVTRASQDVFQSL